MILIEIKIINNMIEDFEYLENKYPSLKQHGLLASKIISDYRFDSREGISVTDMYEQSMNTFWILHQINSTINFSNKE